MTEAMREDEGPRLLARTTIKPSGLSLECASFLYNMISFQFDSKDTSVTQSEMKNIVAAFPALRVLHLRLKGFEASRDGSMNIPSLRELSLNFRGWDHAAWPRTEPLHLFAIMVAPALEYLELVSCRYYNVDKLNVLIQRFPNYPLPQTLKLSNSISNSGACDALLGLFHTVTSLHLIDTGEERNLVVTSSETPHVQPTPARPASIMEGKSR